MSYEDTGESIRLQKHEDGLFNGCMILLGIFSTPILCGYINLHMSNPEYFNHVWLSAFGFVK